MKPTGLSGRERKERFRAAIQKNCPAPGAACFLREGTEAAARLRVHPLWTSHAVILAFLSLPDEIQTGPLLEAAFADGKRVFVPRVEQDRIQFYRMRALDEPLQTGAYGIREPKPEQPLSSGDFPVLVVTPGLAFDRQKKRLGRGKGYYDRFFAALDAAGLEYTACGLCMNRQLTSEIPAEHRDKTMDCILTGQDFLQPLPDHPGLQGS